MNRQNILLKPEKYLFEKKNKMKNNDFKKNKIPVFVAVFFFVLFYGCVNNESKSGDNTIEQVNNVAVENRGTVFSTENAIEAPPFTDGIFPCNDCHSEIEPNPLRRELVDMHDDITAIMNHDNENRWCLDCHDTNNRDSLKLASGKLLDFKESYKLCGQCHGDKLRDWKVGVHGKRTGEWNGKKEYLLCVHCHNPHTPKFKELTPEPPPTPQENIN